MTKSCRQCNQAFEITDGDLEFYDKVSPVFAGQKELIPPPTLCPDCRNQLRLSHRNERYLFNDTCDLTGQSIISFYSPEKKYPVYARDDWWSDRWDPLQYGREVNFTRPLAEQFSDLLAVVPHMNMMLTNSENCDYAPFSINSKSCYMGCSIIGSEHVYYSYQTNESRDCFDCNRCSKCELCIECLQCVNAYGCVECVYCENSSNLFFSRECRSCSNLIGCSNLVNKEYHIFNQPVSKEQFADAVKLLSTAKGYAAMKKRAAAFFLTQPQRPLHNINCENVTGDNLINCRNVQDGFDSKGLEDAKYIFICASAARDVMDNNYCLGTELCYNGDWIPNCYGSTFDLHCWDCRFVHYCFECFHSSNLFLCAGMKNKEYCILNKQYTKEEYEALVPKIIARMRETGEWGEFFPASLSPFGYNQTVAQEYYPLDKDEALTKGFSWSDYVPPLPQVSKVVPASQLPDDIKNIPDQILEWAIECEVSKKPFRVIKQELRFLREHGLPLPRRHPDVRHLDRMKLRNPRKLFDRNCGKCAKMIKTTYPPQSPTTVYCEECYLKEVY